MSLPKEYETAAVEAFEETSYQEIFGLNYSTDPSTWDKGHINVLRKFLTANNGDVEAAKKQLVGALKWRKEYKPLDSMKEEFDPELCKLGLVTQSPDKNVVVWNLYGAVKNPGEFFAQLDKFIRWRVMLHETALSHLDFSSDTRDKMDQVHDYMNVSFLRMDSTIRNASKKVIEMFQSYYPETLNLKFFVNVPYLMMFVFKIVSSFSQGETIKKFRVISNGTSLNNDLGNWIPKTYGGKAENLASLEVKNKDVQDDVD